MRYAITLFLATPLLMISGCGETDPDAPPTITLGDSICVECGMIVSDERFGTASIVQGDRGPESLIFDDFNCQATFEHKHPELTILTRWSRDYESLEWFHTGDGWLVSSPQIRSPMASCAAAFGTIEAAQAFATGVEGQVISYDEYTPPESP